MDGGGNNQVPENGTGANFVRGLLGRQAETAEVLFPAGGKKWRRLLEVLLGLTAVAGAVMLLYSAGGYRGPFNLPVFAVSAAVNGVGLLVGGARGVLYRDDGLTPRKLALSAYLLTQVGCLGIAASAVLWLLGWP